MYRVYYKITDSDKPKWYFLALFADINLAKGYANRHWGGTKITKVTKGKKTLWESPINS